MAVVSASLPDDLILHMDAAIERDGYRGRSEFLRAAMRQFLQQARPRKGGHVHGSLTIVYEHDKEARISDARHAYHDVVLSLMHTHCEAQTCMDVLIVGGPDERVHGLLTTLERMRDVEQATFVAVR